METEENDTVCMEDLSDDQGEVEGDCVLNLTFIGREYLKYGSHKKDHGKLDLTNLAYCYAKYLSKDSVQVSDWEKLFAFENEKKVPLKVCDEVSRW